MSYRERSSVYYLYDRVGACIYVGCSFTSAFARVAHHAAKEWGCEISKAEFTYFDSRIEAADFEDKEIKRLQPRYNVNQKSEPAPKPVPNQFSRAPLWGSLSRSEIHSIRDVWCDLSLNKDEAISAISEMVGTPITEGWVYRTMRRTFRSGARNRKYYSEHTKEEG